MTILVNWPGLAAATAGLTVLLGLTWLLRGDRAALRACFAVTVCVAVIGLAEGSAVVLAFAAVLLAADCWCLSVLRDEGRRK